MEKYNEIQFPPKKDLNNQKIKNRSPSPYKQRINLNAASSVDGSRYIEHNCSCRLKEITSLYESLIHSKHITYAIYVYLHIDR